jgi:tetratricopeptide (TPR) repeat protein
MSARPTLLSLGFFAICVARSAGADAAPAPAPETMADQRLRQIAEHQMSVLSDAAGEPDASNDPDLKAKVDQIVHEYESLLRDNPDYAAGYASYGYMLWKVGARKEAVAVLLKANQLDPNIPLVKNELGNYLAEEGKPMEALNYYLAAIKLEPNQPLYHYQLGSLLVEARDDFLKSGEWTRPALDHSMHEAFGEAARLAPDRIEFVYRYAESFYDMKEPDWPAALKAWEGLEAHAQSDLERQTMRLHEANVLLNMDKAADARKVLDTVTDTKLDAQKQKLVARLAPDGGK